MFLIVEIKDIASLVESAVGFSIIPVLVFAAGIIIDIGGPFHALVITLISGVGEVIAGVKGERNSFVEIAGSHFLQRIPLGGDR